MTRLPCVLLLLLLSAPACQEASRSKPPPMDVAPPGRYPDGPEGLAQLWRDVLGACQKDDRVRVHDLMASMVMTQEELSGLIGGERAQALWSRYQALVGSMANVGAVELVAQVYEKKYDDIAVARIDQLPEASQQPSDRQVLRAMMKPVPLYTVRVKRKAEPKGLRYDFFVYLGGRWRTGNQLGKYLEGPDGGAAAHKGG